MPLSLTLLTPAIGALVQDIQLGADLHPSSYQAIDAALVEHQVLFFRGQEITPQQHRDFAAHFGELHVHPIYPSHVEAPEIIVLDTDLVDLTDNAMWHTDVTFTKTPPMGGVLIARQVPPQGGDTLWASGGAAYDALSQPLRAFLSGLTATHDIANSFPAERFALSDAARERLQAAQRDNPPVVHPVIRTHPVSGRKGLFVHEAFTTRINELSPAESRTLLHYLFAHSTQPQFTVRWNWQVGDVAFWDNRATQHYAVDDYRPHRRVMNRATIIGDLPA